MPNLDNEKNLVSDKSPKTIHQYAGKLKWPPLLVQRPSIYKRQANRSG